MVVSVNSHRRGGFLNQGRVMLAILLILLVIGVVLLRKSFYSKTAFASSIGLVVVVSFLMAIHQVGFVMGIFITAIAGVIITFLDNDGFLA